ncbi:MAG: hypothetical protein ACFE8U_11945, partial [Candidatus Hermodarchaeota archaeon]
LYCQETSWNVQQATKHLKQYQRTLNQKQRKLTKREFKTLKSLYKRLQKAESAFTKWQIHQKNQTIPSVVFGGKKNLQLYQQGKISKHEWTKIRNNGIYCVGEANKQGNANLRIHYDPLTDTFTFSMLLDRGQRNERQRAFLYVPFKYRPFLKMLAQGTQKYTIRLLLASEGTFCRVLITTEHTLNVISNKKGVAGIDLNPTGLAVTLVYPDGNYRCSKWFFCPDLMYARNEKRNWLIGNIVKKALKWIASYQINTISLEGLKFTKRFGTNKRFNRVKTNFVHRKFVQIILAQVIKQSLVVKTVNPAYTSVLGQIKYRRVYGLNSHQAAALVIARRGLGLNEKLYAHIQGKQMVLVVPPMEGWTAKQILRLTREIDEFTAHLSNLTSKVLVGLPQLITRRQGSGGGIVPRNHTLMPSKGASVNPGV